MGKHDTKQPEPDFPARIKMVMGAKNFDSSLEPRPASSVDYQINGRVIAEYILVSKTRVVVINTLVPENL